MNLKRMTALFLMVTLLALAGCGSSSSGKSGPAQAQRPEASGSKDAPQNKEPIVLAGIIGLSGRLADLGKADQAAMEIAAKQINDAGGVLGRPIKLVFYDESGDPAALLKQAETENVFGYMGFESSTTALKWYPDIMKQKKILMVTGAGSPALTDAVVKDPQMNKYLFRNGNHARDWARTAAVYLREIQKAKTYVYLSQDNAFGKSLEPVLAELVQPDGITQVGAAYIPVEGNNFDVALKLIEEKKPDVIVSYLGVSGFAFAKIYSERKIPVPLFDIAANFLELGDKVKAELGNKSDHMALTLFAAPVPITSKTLPFYEAYRSKTGTDPGGLFDVRAADAVTIMAEAIKEAGAVDTDKVISALEQKSFTGVAGIYEFELKSHQSKWGPSRLSGLIGQWQNGKMEIIWPAQNKTANYTLAPWWKK